MDERTIHIFGTTPAKTRKPGSGGKRKGAGPPIGSQNALKPADRRRSVKKTVTFTPCEWGNVEAEMNELGHTQFNNYARVKILNDVF